MRMNNMHTRSVSLAITLILALSPLVALADTSVSVAVPNHCTVTDTDGVAHTYSGQYLGICALEAALEAGSISGAEFSNAFPSLCLFVTSIGGTAADPTSQYWALYQNDGFASVGLSQMTVAADDTIMLELHDFSDNYLGTRFTFTASLIASTPSVSASATGASSLTLHDPFDISLALSYLAANQSADGSFDSSLTSDWAAIAFSRGGARGARYRSVCGGRRGLHSARSAGVRRDTDRQFVASQRRYIRALPPASRGIRDQRRNHREHGDIHSLQAKRQRLMGGERRPYCRRYTGACRRTLALRRRCRAPKSNRLLARGAESRHDACGRSVGRRSSRLVRDRIGTHDGTGGPARAGSDHSTAISRRIWTENDD